MSVVRTETENFRQEIRAALEASTRAPAPVPEREVRGPVPARRGRLATLFRRRKGLPPPGGRNYAKSAFRL